MRFEYFQMIDRIAALDVGERTVRSVCSVPKESTIFEGHFPGYALMPGVLQIECMAQTCGWLVIAINRFAVMPFLIGVKEAKFRSPVFPAKNSNSKARSSTRARASPSAKPKDAARAERSVKRRSLSASAVSERRIPPGHGRSGGSVSTCRCKDFSVKAPKTSKEPGP